MGGLANLKSTSSFLPGHKVVYPVGLNGTNEPVTTTLPEQLYSSASVITYEHPYMRIDIPPPPLEELGCPTSLVDEANTVAAAYSPKTPPKPRISIATEVDDLLARMMTDELSHELEHSPTGKAITVEAVPFPPHKSEASPLPVDTSSQASMEEVEASLECLSANISPITAACSSGSTSPSVDPTEL